MHRILDAGSVTAADASAARLLEKKRASEAKWAEHYDPTEGRNYYVHSETGESLWECPYVTGPDAYGLNSAAAWLLGTFTGFGRQNPSDPLRPAE